MSTPLRHGSRRSTYADEMEKLIADGMSVRHAAEKVGKDHGIAPGTAHAALYEQRRMREGRQPARRATGHHSAPAELQPMLDDLARTQALLDQQVRAIVAWASEVDKRVEERALRLLRSAAKP